MAKFTANNHTSETTPVYPFLPNYRYNPRFNINSAKGLPPDSTIDAPAMAKAMKELHDDLQANMRYAQDRHEQYANAS